ncbi:FAD-dependent oxidoreductase [Terriglobus albidus]|uniref:FAD-dependent oxidoreductase n=1 Tax=Terriglobus albidus TaxID=1592106 RepID=A0A5B9E579_9BACT|nr:FAD-binding protein [Terriglobus albidus]QEE27443.1 FAD-dependent oxidoreductase [Terriglobus albidus]
MASVVDRNDVRFDVCSRGNNARFPASDSQRVAQVEYCTSAEDVVRTLQQAIDRGQRPTVRSSGHCYEDWVVNNPGGVLLDVSMMDRVSAGETQGSYIIQPGAKLGVVYERLYKLGGVVIPGGTCYTVTAGGHVSGGGYGTLARMYGITVDWLTGVEIVIVNQAGKAELIYADAQHHPTLFRALRGGQGSNFGVITAFHFAKLPPMPKQVLTANISWDWKEMTREKFVRIVTTYGDYWAKNDKNPATYPVFTNLVVGNSKSGRVGLGLHYAQTGDDNEGREWVQEYLNLFQTCRPAAEAPPDYLQQQEFSQQQQQRPQVGDTVCYGTHPVRALNWVEATVSGQGGSGLYGSNRRRSKYKSCYMKKGFTVAEANVLYDQMTNDATRGLILAIDSYGGMVNNPARIADTAIPQRSSILKLQYQSYWLNEADDAFRLNGIRQCYKAMYSTPSADPKYPGYPYPNENFEGCYINYADADMLESPEWTTLYYGTGDLYSLLQQVKKEYDPHNLFHHSMSIRPKA